MFFSQLHLHGVHVNEVVLRVASCFNRARGSVTNEPAFSFKSDFHIVSISMNHFSLDSNIILLPAVSACQHTVTTLLFSATNQLKKLVLTFSYPSAKLSFLCFKHTEFFVFYLLIPPCFLSTPAPSILSFTSLHCILDILLISTIPHCLVPRLSLLVPVSSHPQIILISSLNTFISSSSLPSLSPLPPPTHPIILINHWDCVIVAVALSISQHCVSALRLCADCHSVGHINSIMADFM